MEASTWSRHDTTRVGGGTTPGHRSFCTKQTLLSPFISSLTDLKNGQRAQHSGNDTEFAALPHMTLVFIPLKVMRLGTASPTRTIPLKFKAAPQNLCRE